MKRPRFTSTNFTEYVLGSYIDALEKYIDHLEEINGDQEERILDLYNENQELSHSLDSYERKDRI